tara:strand:- start:1678 stop:2391 length:714 start_codon:yes stop_codon:yes gene_type:complete
MATFINITNELLRRMNEVQIDSADFATVKNVQSLAKDAINSSIREILQDSQEWPFTFVTYQQTMAIGTGVYSFPSDYSKADWDTFYLTTTSNTSPRHLKSLSYESYLKYRRADDDAAGANGYSTTLNVYKTQENKFGVTPIPDKEYVIEYRYWKFPADLTLSTDVCIVPDRFKHVVIDGAMMYMMHFRSNEQSAQIHAAKFEDGIKIMRRLVVDSLDYLSSTAILSSSSKTFSTRAF